MLRVKKGKIKIFQKKEAIKNCQIKGGCEISRQSAKTQNSLLTCSIFASHMRYVKCKSINGKARRSAIFKGKKCRLLQCVKAVVVTYETPDPCLVGEEITAVVVLYMYRIDDNKSASSYSISEVVLINWNLKKATR